MNSREHHECFERWMAEHIAILHRVVNGFAAGADREDLMQEVMLAVWKSVPAFRGQAHPTTYLYRVSHNAALAWHRKHRAHAKRDELADPVNERSGSGAENTEKQLEELYAAIRELREADRSLVLLSLDGLSYQEMAVIHGISESNVGARLSRIKQRLTKTLNEKETDETR